MNRLLFACLLALSACGYHFDGGDPITVSVPYVIGDFEGELTGALAIALSQAAAFRYTNGQGDWTLKAKILEATNDRIGYRYDRNPVSGKLRDNVMGIENRKTISVEISIVDSITGKQILGPQIVKAGADYDYVDSNSLQDLSFIDPATGARTTSIAFSLGQLDSVGSAGENAIYPIYDRLAQRIVDGMVASGGWDDE
ncbi:MAG: hypothetical protein K940chlam6_00664 [Chlamydiae bacterium]|nr:hypothetical protein [Chlamydiota bacterium]